MCLKEKFFILDKLRSAMSSSVSGHEFNVMNQTIKKGI